MRDPVFLTLGGKEYSLLPTFAVLDAFETRHGSLITHLERLVQGAVPLRQRAYLVLEAARAAHKDAGQEFKWLLDGVAERMFDNGVADEDQMTREIELCERLLWTPEQYLRKKAEREKAEAEQAKMADLLNALSPSSEPPPSS